MYKERRGGDDLMGDGGPVGVRETTSLRLKCKDLHSTSKLRDSETCMIQETLLKSCVPGHVCVCDTMSY